MKKVSFTRRLAALLYELLMLVAIWMVTVAVFLLFFGPVDTSLKRHLLQISMWLASGFYFVYCWHKSGQTLATQTWKMRLVDAENQRFSWKLAVLRYALASSCLLAFGLGYLWALVDKDGQYLHDRLLKTRYIWAD